MAFDLTGVTSMASNTLLMISLFFIVILFASVVGFLIFYTLKNRKQYDEYDVEIYGADSFGKPILIKDKGGVFVDRKTGNKRFRTKNTKINLNADAIPYIVDGRIGGKKHVKITRKGVSNYYFIKVGIDLESIPTFEVGEEDLNWAINTYEETKKRFNFLNALERWIAPIMFVVAVMIIMIIFVVFFQKLSVLEAFSQNLNVLSMNVKEIVQAQAGNATLVIPA
jgi:hypothetical protein